MLFFGLLLVLVFLFGPANVLMMIIGGLQGIFGAGDKYPPPQSGFARIMGCIGVVATILFLLALVEGLFTHVFLAR